MTAQRMGCITQEVIDLLKLSCRPNTPIYLGDSNISHMKQKHAKDYEKYCKYIPQVLSSPEYIGINPTNTSIEYVRSYSFSEKEYVKVAVRISLSGNYFVRSLYVLNTNRVNNFIKKGTLRKLTISKK